MAWESASLVVGADSVQPTSTCLSTSAESKSTTIRCHGVILTMRSHGFYDLYDPGPPAISCWKPSFVLPAQPSPSSSASMLSFPASTHREPPVPAKSNPPDSATVAVSTGSSASYAPAVAAQDVPPSPGGLSQGAKTAIGICCVVAMVALLAALWLMRRCRRGNRGYLKSPPSPRHHTRAEPGPLSGSHSPLLTPPPSSSSKTMPVTPPPPRLSDRKYLVSMTLGPDPAQFERRCSPATVFPRAPICSPTGKKLASRPENPTATSPSGHSISPDLTQKVTPLTGGPRSSQTGQDGTPGTSPPAAEYKNPRSMDSASLPGTPPMSPSRPRRPHDSLLEVGTVRPASKPPSWALSTPPRGVRHIRAPVSPVLPVSPLSTTSSTNLSVAPGPQHSGMAVALELERNPPASRGARSGPSTGSNESNESYARKKRDTSVSWGSWGGTGAGSRCRAAENRPQGAGDKKGTGGAAMPLQELDLEALGGSY